MIEDAIGWILMADPVAVVASLADLTQPAPATVMDIVARLKLKKVDIIAYETVADAIVKSAPCRARAADLFGGLASVCEGTAPTNRFAQDANGVWVFQE